MVPEFPSGYNQILEKMDQIDPLKYGESRNYVDGAVTYLSPYISRGVISTKQVLENILAKGYQLKQIESFVKELCWRDYFQRVAQHKDVNSDIKQPQKIVLNHGISTSILDSESGISGIDHSIKLLYESGYMHNHCRMYTAFLACNCAKSHWLLPAKWMYYHLIDGDWASNACSWQWVAGSNSSKEYIANQENINKYTHTEQTGTFLDHPYETIVEMEVPDQLLATESVVLKTDLPQEESLILDETSPTFIYNYYNLDPLWRSEENGNRILLLEPSFFESYPISEKGMTFMLSLTKNIPGIQVFVGSFESLCTQFNLKNVYFKEHPLNIGYSGVEDPRDWIAEEVQEYYPSFFGYWKKVEKQLSLKYTT